jgi:hypothetical protein
MPDLIAALAVMDSGNSSPELFVGMLLSLGFVDNTPTESPYQPSIDVVSPIVKDIREKLNGLSERDRNKVLQAVTSDE